MKRLLFFSTFKDNLDTENSQSPIQKQKNTHFPVRSPSTWRHRFTSGKVGGRGGSRRSSGKTISMLVEPTVVAGALHPTRVNQPIDEKTILEKGDYKRHRLTENMTPTTLYQPYHSRPDNKIDDDESLALPTTTTLAAPPPPPPRRPFSCSAINMPEILHVLRMHAYEDTGSLQCVAPSSKFEYPSIKEDKIEMDMAPGLTPGTHQAPQYQQRNSSRSSNQSQSGSRHSKATTRTITGEDTYTRHTMALREKEGPSETITQLLVERTMCEMKLAQAVTQLEHAMQEIKRLKHQICHLSDNDLVVFRLQTRAQLGLIEYLEGEDNIAAALERFKRQLETSHHPSAQDSC
ncbi:hypothetical protein BX666DRAFT_2023834 [Dichotomocladium elegans]|nr:hypothetical protein BX666DRAFT_2023834 [Dichotomocladium elegans]